MNSQHILELIVSDLKNIEQFRHEQSLKEIPDGAMDYLLMNYDLIDFYLRQVYDKTNREQREELRTTHTELHYVAAHDDFYEIAKEAVNDAKRFWGHPDTQSLTSVGEDQISMLLRGLAYAKYIPLDNHDFKLELSPITQYGFYTVSADKLKLLDERFRTFLNRDFGSEFSDDWGKLAMSLHLSNTRHRGHLFGASLVASSFDYVNFTNVRFTHCDLGGTSFKASLIKCNCERTRFDMARFWRCEAEQTLFLNCSFSDAIWEEDYTFRYCWFEHCDLTDLTVKRSTYRETVFRGCSVPQPIKEQLIINGAIIIN